jgi:hypothetical protein
VTTSFTDGAERIADVLVTLAAQHRHYRASRLQEYSP